MIDYTIISTGSKGNAVVINGEIMIDCGVSFRALKGVYTGLKLVLLTHIHSDHFRKPTVRKLAQERPSLRFGCCEWLVEPLVDCGVSKKNIDIYIPDTGLWYGENFPVAVWVFPLVHNVPNCGYRLHLQFDGKKTLFYATDTSSLDGIEAKNYNLYLIEANHSESDINERIRRKEELGEYCYEHDAKENHMSHEKASAWLYENMGGHSQYVLLHQHED